MNDSHSYEFEFPVFRLLPVPEKLAVVAELRDEFTRSVHVELVDFERDISIRVSPEVDEWWAGLEAVTPQWMLIHGYKTEQTPEHLGLEFYSIDDGELIHHFSEVRFDSTDGSEIYALDDEGAILKFENADFVPGSLPESATADSGILKPEIYPNEHSYFETVAAFVKELNNSEPVLDIEYLEHDGKVIISYYICLDEKHFSNRLLLLTSDGTVLEECVLAEQVRAKAEGVFFIYKGHLIYLIENKTLKAIKI